LLQGYEAAGNNIKVTNAMRRGAGLAVFVVFLDAVVCTALGVISLYFICVVFVFGHQYVLALFA
jgi:hypothetical protein